MRVGPNQSGGGHKAGQSQVVKLGRLGSTGLQGHTNQSAGRKILRGKVFKDEQFEAKRRDGKHGIIVSR